MYVYVPESFKAELRHHADLKPERFEQWCDELEGMTLQEARSRFETIYPFLKRKENNFRLIAEIRRLGDDFILCWLKVYLRGSQEYRKFLDNRKVGVNITHEQLQAFLQENQTQTNDISSPKPLPEEYHHWLDRPNWQFDSNQDLVYESRLWLQGSKTSEFQQKQQQFYDAVCELVNDDNYLGEKTNWSNVWFYQKAEVTIIYSKVLVEDDSCNSVLILFSPFFQLPTSDQITGVIEYIFSLGITPEDLLSCRNLDCLATLAYRAYPVDILSDENAWFALEQNAEVNLALSTEERKILDDVSSQGDASLPLFLNGQAGSGKSTMLFYLFADYCHRYLKQHPKYLTQPHPLFLAYNRDLVDFAQKQVTVILAAHHRFVADGTPLKLDSGLDISPCFQRFRDLLRQILPPEERAYFKENKYVSFYNFRQRLKHNNWPYSPERCWQVIRTFIKGYTLSDGNNYLNATDYREDIPRSEQTVSPEEFEGIYETVWKWYKKYLEAEQRWDDQDLVRKVLQLPGELPKYTAIFCDEAQDFTRLELQAIMRLSVLYEYDLEHTHVKSLPFAFAGDPLQTLNPTGFRWESLKANFYEEVIGVLFPTDHSKHQKIKLNVGDLKYNYRSTQTIVSVNNLIQLWRKFLFRINDLNPQESRSFQGTKPQKFIIDSNVSAAQIQERLMGKIIIIPCDEGGEREYIKGDAILSALYEDNGETEKRAWNVLSAIAAKGLEFKQVVIYKFGDVCPLRNWEPQDSVSEVISYFFNKLYVAVSRATEQLLILDTQEGDGKLWSQANQFETIEDILHHITDLEKQQQWRSRVCLIEVGELTSLDETTNSEDDAQTFEQRGIRNKDANDLIRAAGAYRHAKNELKALYCEALALQFEEEFEQAGQLFEQLEDWDKVLDCYWQGKVWNQLQLICDRVEKMTAFQKAIVQFMVVATLDWTMITEFSQQLPKAVESENELLDSSQFEDATQRYIKWVESATKQPDSLQIQQWQFLGNTLQLFKNSGDPKVAILAVKCFYLGQDYPATVSYAEDCKISQIREYYLAKAQVLGFPAGLGFLSQAQEYQQVIQLWKQNNKPRDREWLNVVATAYESLESYKNALAIYSWLDNLEKVKSCLHIIQSRFPQDFIRALQFTIKYYIDDGYWLDAIATLETHTELLNNPDNTSFKQSLVNHLAKSDLTPNTLNTDLRKGYETFLKQQILASNWQQFVSMEYVGVTLEKIGSLVPTLRFYEQFTATSSFAQKRWLATKLRQAQDYQDIEKTQKAEAQAIQKAQQWQIALQDITIAPPDLTDVPVFSASPSTHPEIRNLPPDIIPETRDRDLICFQIDGLEIRIMGETQQVLILDILTEKSLRIEGRSPILQSQQFTLQNPQGEALHFSDNQGKYRGVVTFNPLQLELILPDRDRPIEICWD
ncbi:MAG: hypothetical protein ACLFV6_04845 [Spirulinaceae cyanobacterium]